MIMSLSLVVISSRQLTDSMIPPPPAAPSGSSTADYAANLAIAAIGFIFAVILLVGALKKIPALIKAWMVWTIVVVFIMVIQVVLSIIFGRYLTFIGIIISVAFQMFCFWVVRVFLADITSTQFKDETGIVGPGLDAGAI
ncbi:unnamed protein product [Allacma fusca]|uniref:Uncharacterized protein n=1 Tax=Allacma fusca TaxID=39272 RepID=A0A8J2Q6H5_9HEXA|nr:unnamed protein product [Allacma fusca]